MRALAFPTQDLMAAYRSAASGSGGQDSTGPEADGNALSGLSLRFAKAEIDCEWDTLVEATPGGDLVQTTSWAVTRQRIGISVWHLCLFGPDGVPVGGCLIQCRRVFPGLWLGVVPRGPLMFVDAPGLANWLIRELIHAARRVRIFLLVVQPPEGNTAIGAAMCDAGFRLGGPSISPNATIRIDLQRTEEEILKSAHTTRRTQIRRGVRGGLECLSGDDIEVFHRLHVASAKRLGFPPISIGNLKAQWEVLRPRGMCHLIEVRQDGIPIGGEWLTCFGGTVTNKLRGQDWSAISNSPASKSAGAVSVWAAICWARSSGARYFDFGGLDRSAAKAILAGEPLPANVQSWSEFKRSFGGSVILLPQSHFLFTIPLLGWLFGRLAAPLLTSPLARWLGMRVRATYGRRESAARFS